MENRKETAYRFSYCLFAYLYKKVHTEVKLPLNTDYRVPTTSLFSCEIGDCVLKLLSIFKPYLERVISDEFPRIRSEEDLFEFAKWYSQTLLCLESFTFLKLMTLCSVLTELVVYYFHKKCYFFISSAPTCLSEILLSSQVFFHYNPLSLLFTELKNFSSGILQDRNIYSNNLQSILSQEAKYLENNFMFLFLNKCPKNSNDKSICQLKSEEKCKTLQLDSDSLTKLDEFNIENLEDASQSKGISNTVGTLTLKRKDPTYNSEIVIKTKEIKMSIPTSLSFQSSEFTCGIFSPLKPICLPSGPKLSSYSNRNSEDYNQEEDFDFSACFQPFDYDNVDEFNPSFELDSKTCNFDLAELKPKSCYSVAKLCAYCNYCCLDLLSDFIDDFKETNYESD